MFDRELLKLLKSGEGAIAEEFYQIGGLIVFQVERLIALYPVLQARPVRAGITVFENCIFINPFLEGSSGDGTIAEVSRLGGVGHRVGLKDDKFICDCDDYKFRLRAIRINDGTYQQPCYHILTLVLSVPEYIVRFIGDITPFLMDGYEDIQAMKSVLAMDKAGRLKEIIPVEVLSEVTALELEVSGQIEAANENLERYERAMKEIVLAGGKTVSGERWQIRHVSGRKKWNTKKLEELAGKYPEILEAREISDSYSSVYLR